MPTTAMSVKLPKALHERLNAVAAASHRTAHAIAKDSIEAYVEIAEARVMLHQTSVEAWESYLDTGLHVTGDEVTRWVDTWGTDTPQPPPTCHV